MQYTGVIYDKQTDNSHCYGSLAGIGAGVVQAFLASGYNVVGTSMSATKSEDLSASDHLALIDGDIGQFETAQKVAELAVKQMQKQKSGGSIVSITSSMVEIRLPIQGPLGGLSSHRLTDAVSNFAGLVSFGAHGFDPDEIRKVITVLQSFVSKSMVRA